MRKEVLIAIIIGFSVGLVIAFGIWTADKSLKKAAVPEKSTPPGQIEEASPTSTPSSLNITSLPDNFLSSQEKIQLSGKTTPEATIVVFYEEGEKILAADTEGIFSLEITLVGGANEIKISSFDQDGTETSKTITGVYSTVAI